VEKELMDTADARGHMAMEAIKANREKPMETDKTEVLKRAALLELRGEAERAIEYAEQNAAASDLAQVALCKVLLYGIEVSRENAERIEGALIDLQGR
jgi:hypothetical protein